MCKKDACAADARAGELAAAAAISRFVVFHQMDIKRDCIKLIARLLVNVKFV
jgi:hypothetical protein